MSLPGSQLDELPMPADDSKQPGSLASSPAYPAITSTNIQSPVLSPSSAALGSVISSPSRLKDSHLNSQTNGHSNGKARNGFSPIDHSEAGPSSGKRQAGVPVPGARLYNEGSHLDKGEFIRITLQALRDCGYKDSAALLEHESGYVLEATPVADMRSAIMGGRWDEALGLLETTGIAGTKNETAARFFFAEQKYLELLASSMSSKALGVLRKELAPLNYNSERLHQLSSYVLCIGEQELYNRSGWDGAQGTSRQKTLDQILTFIPSNYRIPERRMGTLLDQALRLQSEASLYLVQPSGSLSLLSDQTSSRSQFPLIKFAACQEHTDEVWNLAWSNDGTMLASTGKDKHVVVHHVGVSREGSCSKRVFKRIAKFEAHPAPIGNLCWSPDDKILITTAEHQICVWNTKTWELIKVLDQHQDFVSAVRWSPDGSFFISSGEDGKLLKFDRAGPSLVKKSLVKNMRLFDFDFTPDGKHFIGVAVFPQEPQPKSLYTNSTHQRSGGYQEPKFYPCVFDSKTLADISQPDRPSVKINGDATSFRLSRDGQCGIINRQPDEIQIWSFKNLQPELKQSLRGHRQKQFYLRSCFAGPNDNLVVSGSEDGYIYVWHRGSGQLLEIIKGHKRPAGEESNPELISRSASGTVNAVSWRPEVDGEDSAMFASCGDDGQVLLWEPAPPGTPLPPKELSLAHAPNRNAS
ncbi:WD40 repeat-containing protein [Phaffia rhodozyma]|uniref:WD40 repeat-containing protein n=1 Tax=Phaffia rhodozyma TaxID=264483 RepID=A0A0F7SX19_PHARH|nr:WD40 repeat-containing protein [Phaffia rhodozyma]